MAGGTVAKTRINLKTALAINRKEHKERIESIVYPAVLSVRRFETQASGWHRGASAICNLQFPILNLQSAHY